MKKAYYYHFLLRKSVEEEFIKRHGSLLPTEVVREEEIEIRDEPPKLLHLFPWEITKLVTTYDVLCDNALELSLEQGEHISKCWNMSKDTLPLVKEENPRGNIPIEVWDLDTDSKHNGMFLAKMKNDPSYFICGNWFGDFVVRRSLMPGMMIGMYWDVRNALVCFSVLEKQGLELNL